MAKAKRPAIKPASQAEFRKTMQDFADDQKADIEMVEREQMRLMMRDAMTFSAPMPKGGGQGLSKAAWNAGKNKLGNDVRRIFIPMDSPVKGKSVFLRQIVNAVKLGRGAEGGFGAEWLDVYTSQTAGKIRGLSPVLRKIMQDTDHNRAFQKASNYLNKANILGTYRPVAGLAPDPRPIHDKYKNAVNGRWPKNAPIGGPQYFIDTTAALNAYIAERQLKVGWIKAGYADALSKIPLPVYKGGNTRNFGAYDAPWVDANKAGYGTFSVTKTSKGSACAMVAGNNIGNINNVADDADTKNIVYGNRVQNILNTVASRNRDSIKRANRRRK